jgi:hypothetical protein
MFTSLNFFEVMFAADRCRPRQEDVPETTLAEADKLNMQCQLVAARN